MSTPAEIIFVGLCSFINVADQYPDLPPPSVIVMKHSSSSVTHQTFIAYDSKEVTMTGETSKPLGASNFSSIELPGGEELTFNDDRTALPRVDSSFDRVVRFLSYSKIASPAWDEDYIPKRKKLPKKVAAYIEFGGGTLSATHLTKVKWEFKNSDTTPDTSVGPECYARQVHYEFQPTGDGLLIEARMLDGSGKRTMLFKPKGSANKVRVWIGSSVNPLHDIKQVEPSSYSDGKHFAAFFVSEKGADDKKTVYLPRPISTSKCGGEVEITTGEGDPETGYCGPDSRP